MSIIYREETKLPMTERGRFRPFEAVTKWRTSPNRPCWFLARSVAACALNCCCFVTAAGDLKIGTADCARGVRLVASNVSADDVLRRLSTSLGFELSVEGRLDALVNIDATDRPERLIERVLPEGFMIERGADPRCPGKPKVVRVFVVTPTLTPRSPARVAVVPIVPRTPDPSTQAYLQAHGFMPATPASAASQSAP